MDGAPLVSDLVLHVLEASSAAIAKHFYIAFEATKDFDAIRRKCISFDGGEMQDLEDSEEIAKGFDHDAISEIFRGFPYRPNSTHGVNRHIWGADDDHHLRSLVRTGVGRKRERTQEGGRPDDDQRRARIHSRTRVSALVQQALLRSRRVVQFEKASTAIKDMEESHVFTPSPFYIAKQILTDPTAPATEAYASAALNIEMLRRLRPRFGEVNLNHQSIQRALELIWNRAFTSKPIRSSGDSRGETLYLCHHLAMKGILSLQVEWKRQSPADRPDKLFNSINSLFDLKTRAEAANRTHPVSFRLHPGFADTPDAGELLNELRGLPLPVEGASTIFHQGLRFGSNGEIVAAISGPAGVGNRPKSPDYSFVSPKSKDASRPRPAVRLPRHRPPFARRRLMPTLAGPRCWSEKISVSLIARAQSFHRRRPENLPSPVQRRTGRRPTPTNVHRPHLPMR